MPLNGLRWSRDSGSAHCDMPQSAVLGRPGGGLCHCLPVFDSVLLLVFFYILLIMPVIIPLHNAGGRCVASSANEGGAPRVGVVDEGLYMEVGQRVMDDLVGFLCGKGDKGMIEDFQHILSDYSRANCHMFDAQLERLDMWQMNERKQKEKVLEAVMKGIMESRIDVRGNYYNIHDNSIEK